jgi:hypothetical protein
MARERSGGQHKVSWHMNGWPGEHQMVSIVDLVVERRYQRIERP